MHYDLGALSLWLGLGVALIVGGVQVAGWRHRAIIGGLITLGSVCIFAALAAPLFANSWPSISGFMSQTAAPSSWVSLLLFIAALFLFSRPRATPTAQVVDGEDRARDTQSLRGVERRLTETQDQLSKALEQIERLKESLESSITAASKRMMQAEHDTLDEHNSAQASISKTASQLREGIAELNNRLVAEVAASEKKWSDWVQELCKRIDQGTSFTATQHKIAMAAISDIREKIAVDFPNSSNVAEAFRNLDSAVHLKEERVGQDIHRLREQFRLADMDIIFLFNFAVDSVTIRFLNRIISESPVPRGKNVGAYDDPKARDRQCLLLEKYARDVLGWVGRDTHRGIIAADVAKNAESEMEEILLNTPERERPHNIDPYVLRRYTIAELKCIRLVTFLEMERDQVAARLTGQRDGLLERQRTREDSKKAIYGVSPARYLPT